MIRPGSGDTMAKILRATARGGVHEGVADGDLLARYAEGSDDDAFDTLVRRHTRMVLGVARRVLGGGPDAEDVCQATFLLLARKASGGVRRESVAGWLYATARLTALNARRARQRRQRVEARAAGRKAEPSDPLDRISGAELVTALDQELARLPDRYRGPLVLCCLEGLSRDEAARRLGVAPGTLKVQLERGRERLRAALARRGIELGAALLVVTTASATCSAGLQLTRAIRAAAGGRASRDAAALALGISAMTKKTLLLIGFLAAGLLGAAGVWAGGKPAPADDARAESQPKPAGTRPPPERQAKDEIVTFRGRVLTHARKPASAARMFLIDNYGLLSELGATDADGRFAVGVARPATKHGKLIWLAARLSGFGTDFVELNEVAPGAEIELRLPADRPIRGRVIDTQGQPVAGAKIRLGDLSVYGEESIEPFLKELLKRPNFRSPGASKTRCMFGGTRDLLTAATDKEGRFEFLGAGDERLVDLRVSGPGIASTSVEVVTRPGFDPRPYNEATLALRPKGTGEQLSWSYNPLLVGPEPTVIVESEKPIRGTVTEAATGKPRAGVRVRMDQDNGTQRSVVEATTDRDGHYEFRGAAKAPRYTLAVDADAAAGFFGRSVTVPDSTGYEPIEVAIPTARGVIVTGRVTDRSTGEPLPGRVRVGPLADNSNVDRPEYAAFVDRKGVETAADGTFRLVSIPGPVLVMIAPEYSRLPGGLVEGLRYRSPVPDPRFPDFFRVSDGTLFYRGVRGYPVVEGNFCQVVDARPGAVVDAALELASVIRVSLRDEAGRPVAGTHVAGLTAARFTAGLPCETADVRVYGVAEGGRPRAVAFFDTRSRLTATVTLRGDERQPVVVTLRPPGVLRGRLLKPDGSPAEGVTVSAEYPDNLTVIFKEAQQADGCVLTDKDGVFRFDAMLPGTTFTLLYSRPSGQRRFQTPTNHLDGGRAFGPVKASEAMDIGAVTLLAANGRNGE
jgi:RNA polymerase sigma factor (sigma-70 family)